MPARHSVGVDVVQAAEVPEAQVRADVDVGAVAEGELALEGFAVEVYFADDGGERDEV